MEGIHDIENPKGSTRSGQDEKGKVWTSKMYYDYGYFLGHSNSDHEHLDVFIGDNPTLDTVHVVDQTKPNGNHDEFKCVIGAKDKDEALAVYLKNYEKGWKNYKGVEAYTLDGFKEFTEKLDKKNPLMNKTGGEKEMIKISKRTVLEGVDPYYAKHFIDPVLDDISNEFKRIKAFNFKTYLDTIRGKKVNGLPPRVSALSDLYQRASNKVYYAEQGMDDYRNSLSLAKSGPLKKRYEDLKLLNASGKISRKEYSEALREITNEWEHGFDKINADRKRAQEYLRDASTEIKKSIESKERDFLNDRPRYIATTALGGIGVVGSAGAVAYALKKKEKDSQSIGQNKKENMEMIKISGQTMRKSKSSDPTLEESAWAILGADKDLWKPYVKRTDGEISDKEFLPILKRRLQEVNKQSIAKYERDVSEYKSLPPKYTEKEIESGVRSGRALGAAFGGLAGGAVGLAAGIPISAMTNGSAIPYSLLGMLGGSIYLGKAIGDLERDRYKRNPYRDVPNKDDVNSYPLLSKAVYNSYKRDIEGDGDGRYLEAFKTDNWLPKTPHSPRA